MMGGLSENVVRSITAVLARHEAVEKALLYGSRALGREKIGSDIDIALVGSGGLTTQTLYKIINELDDLSLPYTIDVSLFHHIDDSPVRQHILRAGLCLYEKPRPAINA